MEPVYYRPYIVYHKDHDENNPILIPFDTTICKSKQSAEASIDSLANMFLLATRNHHYQIRKIDGFPYIFKRIRFRQVVIAFTNIGKVYEISDNEYSYFGYIVRRVGNTFQVYNPGGYLIGIAAIDKNDLKALNEALLIIDTNFHSHDYLKSILNLERKEN